jgi:uncharacterized protein YjbI with pentapeptide repeats
MVSDRRKQILRASLWALAAVAAVAALVGVFVLVFMMGPSMLIHPPKTGLSEADLLKARNDARTTLVQALAGLAVAGGLVVTYNTYRQNRQEQKDTRQDQDRTYERELYTKAVEQIAHEKAPVRLAGLYSLERLAEEQRPARRQIVADIICAYLCMPFSPTAPAIKPEPEATEAPEVPASETERRTEGTDYTWKQERQVRLTAQHILSMHLRDDRARFKRSTDPPDPRFWPGIRLNLAGATLIDFDLRDGVLADADFHGATFTGDAVFGGATFTGDAVFGGATFNDNAVFGEAIFTGNAEFYGATFTGNAEFGKATFTDAAWFDGATFTDAAWFDGATFSRVAWFGRATFSRVAGFRGTIFSDKAEFGRATFNDNAEFRGTTFTGNAGFRGTTFNDNAEFGRATFNSNAEFRGTTFNDNAGFRETTFTDAAWFGGATFNGNAEFGEATFTRGGSYFDFDRSRVASSMAEQIWPTGSRLEPDGSGGYTVVRADDGLDTGLEPEEPPGRGDGRGAERHDGV